MTEAFSEVFGNEFDKNNFPGMIITYDESGVPIVTDPDAPQKSAVYAGGKYEINGFYSSLRLFGFKSGILCFEGAAG